MKLIVITHYEYVPEEAVKINALFEAGLKILHIRKPKSLKKDCCELLDRIDPRYYSQIKIHDFFDLANHYPILGVHLNSRNPVYRGENQELKISKSCHTIEELDQIEDRYDYVFLSPVFNSISKTAYRSKFTDEMLREASTSGKINRKVIALGGINEHNLPLLKTYPWGGVAVLGSIWESGDVASNYLKLKNLL
jgi:thiamine-phosphate pyrophosphorylase